MRQYRGGFGHNPSGKLYTYLGENGLRIGQHVVAPVEKERNDGTSIVYNTMFTIMKTNDEQSQYAVAEEERLNDLGIRLKTIIGTNVIADLPGGQRFLNDPRLKTLQAMKSAWTRESNVTYREDIIARLKEF